MSAQNTSIFVNNIAFSASTQNLGDAFAAIAPVKSARIITMRYRGKIMSRGFGFVEFTTREGLEKALKAAPVNINGRAVRVTEARPQVRCVRDTAFASLLPAGITEDNLKSFFANYKPINCKIITPRGEGRLPYAFIQFENEELQTKAVKENGKFSINGSNSVLRFSLRPFNSPIPKPGRTFRRLNRAPTA